MNTQYFLYKYQPKYFSDYCFPTDSNVINTIQILLETKLNNILLWGEENTGKTTILNSIILEYYKDISPKLYEYNVLHINNITEQGITYFRTKVKHFCQICSGVPNKKKIVVLDNIDLITDQSQHAFRSLMDNYSKNVMFIASTKNIQNVIDTVQSRFTVVKLPTITPEIANHLLQKIKQTEQIEMDSASEDMILRITNNNLKQITQLMQKFHLLNEPIHIELVKELCFSVNFVIFDQFMAHLLNGQLLEAIQIMYDIFYKGYSVIDILNDFFIYVKQTIHLNEDCKYQIIKLISTYIGYFHTIHEDEIELAFFTNQVSLLMS